MGSLKETFFPPPLFSPGLEKRAEKAAAPQARTTERGAGLHAVSTMLSVARHDRSRKMSGSFHGR
jgi:hypothetical protein